MRTEDIEEDAFGSMDEMVSSRELQECDKQWRGYSTTPIPVYVTKR